MGVVAVGARDDPSLPPPIVQPFAVGAEAPVLVPGVMTLAADPVFPIEVQFFPRQGVEGIHVRPMVARKAPEPAFSMVQGGGVGQGGDQGPGGWIGGDEPMAIGAGIEAEAPFSGYDLEIRRVPMAAGGGRAGCRAGYWPGGGDRFPGDGGGHEDGQGGPGGGSGNTAGHDSRIGAVGRGFFRHAPRTSDGGPSYDYPSVSCFSCAFFR